MNSWCFAGIKITIYTISCNNYVIFLQVKFSKKMDFYHLYSENIGYYIKNFKTNKK